MIINNKEFYSSPYYFFLKETKDKYSLYFSVEETLTEARKKDSLVQFHKDKEKEVKSYLKNLLKKGEKKTTQDVKGEIEELVNADGGLSSSKIPILDPRLHPKKTMDQTVAAARITNDPISRGYRTYYGESVEDDVNEIDMSKAFGYEETEDMDGKETYKYMVKKLNIDPDEAKERVKQQGKDPSGKKDKKSKYYKDKNFITRATLSEIQKQNAIKMVEDILMKKRNQNNSDVNKKDKEISSVLKKNIKVLAKQMDKEGLSKKDLIKLLDSE